MKELSFEPPPPAKSSVPQYRSRAEREADRTVPKMRMRPSDPSPDDLEARRRSGRAPRKPSGPLIWRTNGGGF